MNNKTDARSNTQISIRGAFAPPRKRKRTTYSCQACRKRKIKCDTAQPCQHCRSSAFVCTYEHPIPDRSTPTSTKDLASVKHHVQVEYLPTPRGYLSDTLIDDADSIAWREQSANSDFDVSRDTRAIKNTFGGMKCLDIFTWPAMRSYLTPTELSRASSGAFLSSYEDRNLATQVEGLPEIVDGRVIDSLIGIFFRQVHIKHPLFELDIARQCREQQYRIGHDLFGATVSIMMALGALVAEEQFAYLQEYQKQAIAMADVRLHTFMLGMTLDHVRIVYLYGMLQLFQFRPWAYMQMVSLAASKVAIIHDLEGLAADWSLVRQSEQRLYWSCWKGEEELQFFWRDYTPRLKVDEALELSFPTPPAGPSDPYGLKEESWFYYLSEIAAHKISHRVMNLVSEQFERKQLDSAVIIARRRQDLALQVDSWYESLPEFLRFPVDASFEIRDHIETTPHIRSYYFLIFGLQSMYVIYHGLHSNLDSTYDECLKEALHDIRRALMHYSGRSSKRLHFGSYFMMLMAIDLASITMLCLQSPRFVGLIDPAAEAEAVLAMAQQQTFLQRTKGLRKGLEIFHRIHGELSTSG